ncbi:MAG: MG2 domain-containing protein, partial [Akkermansiaceae bacterium]
MIRSILISILALTCIASAQKDERTKASKLYQQDNYAEALTIYEKLLTDHNDTKSGNDLLQAVQCLKKLNRTPEVDALLEKSIAAQPKNYRLLRQASHHFSTLPHYGYIIAGEFKRGHHRGGGQYAFTTERDRIRSIQLALQAIKHAPKDTPGNNMSQLFDLLSRNVFQARSGNESWRLQKLTDLSKLPDVEPGSRWQRGGRSPQGAPVDSDGNALFYKIPATWEQAKNDGERWRWAIQQAAKHSPSNKDHYQLRWANFLRSQFGVTTMAHYGWFGQMDSGEQKGILAIHTLKDTETLAKLATGVKRFDLPADQNFIAIHQSLADRNETAADQLIRIYLDRRQHEKSAALLEKTIAKFASSRATKNRKKLLHQITGNWGQFDSVRGSSPAGIEPTVSYTFRNAKSVTITAREVDMDSMVNNLWKYLEGNPLKLKWDLVNLSNLANSLVNGTRKKYVGKEVGRRIHTLKPRPHHWDTRVSLSVPVKKSGAYLVSAVLEEGVTVHTVVWLDATALVQKDIKGGELHYLADARTGKAIANAEVEIFGYYQKRRKKPGIVRKYDIFTKRVTKTTGADGTFIIKNGELDSNYQWMTRAKSDQGFSLLGFSRFHSSVNDGGTWRNRKTFGITDRPVYQPAQKVFGKVWIRDARYDLKDVSTYAGQKVSIVIQDPSHIDVLKQNNIVADQYGGVEYEYSLPEEAKLGQYRVLIYHGKHRIGYHSFRVEEYKKPEYEVGIDAPKEAIMLGEKFNATVRATYYHGAPVSGAKVKVKVLRTRHNDRWFPAGPWDWLYGSGYGWFDIERPWYPGWRSWGCRCPHPSWWHRGGEQPEIVLERELDISPDGTVKVEIDTALAKAVHGDTDHRYQITAEVVDASRRTIVGSGSIIAARQAFNVSVWLDRGYARVGEPINATVAARTVDGKKLTTNGKFTLYRITSQDGKAKETEVKSWQTDTTKGTNGSLKFQAGAVGHYRLAATMTDAKNRTIEGAIIFTVRGDADSKDADGEFIYSDIELITDKRTYTTGDKVKLLINTKRPNSTVLLSLRGGTEHRFVHLKGHSTEIEIPVTQKDMPNFFVEAATVSNADVHTAVREVIVP